MKLELFRNLQINLLFGLFIFLFFPKCANKQVKNLPKVLKDGMVMIPSGDFLMGSNDEQARDDESPLHPVHVNAFWMDITEVTNLQFKEFVDATGYITTAEKNLIGGIKKRAASKYT